MQDGKVFEHPKATSKGLEKYNSLTDESCGAFKTSFGDVKDFQNKGGLKQMGKAMEKGMTLVMSLWDDHA